MFSIDVTIVWLVAVAVIRDTGWPGLRNPAKLLTLPPHTAGVTTGPQVGDPDTATHDTLTAVSTQTVNTNKDLILPI